jgi:hypothetical protein
MLAAGLGFGLVAAVVCLVWRRRDRPPPPAGLLLAAAGVAGIAATTEVEVAPLAAGLVVLGAGGAALGRAGTGTVATRRLARTGALALLLGGAGLTLSRVAVEMGAVVRAGLVLALCLAAVSLLDFDRRWPGLALPLLALTALGVYATVPDVEPALVVLGAAAAMAPLRCLPGPVPLGPAGATASAGLLAWATAAGGAGRPGSLVGGFACFGLLMVEPLSRRVLPGGCGPVERLGGPHRVAWPVLVAQLALAGVAARVVGRPTGLAAALLLAGLELAALAAVAVAACRRHQAIHGTDPPEQST